ncbi:uncharacterized protein [Venturia canescens]|uniref:uncharacterized protein n=1 Tax=Venturia canescens TaxID=32260 RepID=UPI001C9C816B|nr:uncharacterized protein LOC122415574 [Venturia canescens]
MLSNQKTKKLSDSENESSDDESLCDIPPDLKGAAEKTKIDLLPSKSKKIYEYTYDAFVKWKRERKTNLTSETILMAYFKELSEKYKPSTLWSIYSMLKATLKIKEKIEIDTYHTFKEFIKKQSSGFTSNKSKVFTSENIQKFLSEAPNSQYLATKVALIFGISGACRSNELVKIKLDDIKKQGDLLVVNLPAITAKKPRTFVIAEEFTQIVQQYTDRRPQNATTDRFFVNFQKGKCTSQVIGIHKFSRMPKEIATYLKLDDPAKYTGHAFRRTSATLLADSGANMVTLKRPGGRKSGKVARSYVEKSVKNVSNIGNVISEAIDFTSAGPSKQNDNPPSPKRPKIEICTTDGEILDTQLNEEDITNPPTKHNFIFQNCTIVINPK